jgi:hypothetical protein
VQDASEITFGDIVVSKLGIRAKAQGPERKISAKISGQGNTLIHRDIWIVLYVFLSSSRWYEQKVCFLEMWLFAEYLSGDSSAWMRL